MDNAMDAAAQVLAAAHELYIRANETTSAANATTTDSASKTNERPPTYKIIGISLAISSGAFIGTSFVLKKVGLLKANEKYNEVAGEGYGYLKNVFWWSGMTLMILGEICNFVAYAFTDAILVTPLGALSVVITTILSAIFLKERLSMVGKVACFLCIVGSVVIVMNAPQESSVADIQEMQHFVVAPGFLSFAGVILVGSAITAFWAGPRWGKKNMLVYLSICSWVGGLSVVATQGLGSAIVAQAGGKPQFNQWFLYVLLVFVICTLLTEIIYLNKALNLFNAAMVTPTYYVYFTSTTIITSAVLFQGFKGTVTSIVTVVNGFLTICSGVVLLQLSKSAKDVPDTAVFTGDLDQIQTIAEQEQPESEPKADAIRGAAAIVRRFSTARQNMEVAELKRLHEEKMRERLEAVNEDGTPNPPQYEWDGIRRRRTTIGSQRSRSQTVSSAAGSGTARPFTPGTAGGGSTPHPPLGWSHVPTADELAALDRPTTPGVLASIAGTIRARGRSRGRSVLLPTHNAYGDEHSQHPQLPQVEHQSELASKIQSPMHPVQLTEFAVPISQQQQGSGGGFYGLPSGQTEYLGAAGYGGGVTGDGATDTSVPPPDPPPHSAKRQFSFQNVFRRHQQHAGVANAGEEYGSASVAAVGGTDSGYRQRPVASSRGYSAPQVKGSTEEERLGLVKGDSRSVPALPTYEDEEMEMEVSPKYYTDAGAVYDPDPYYDRRGAGIAGAAGAATATTTSATAAATTTIPPSTASTTQPAQSTRYGRGITTPPRRGSEGEQDSRSGSLTRQATQQTPPPPPPGGHRYSPPRGGNGAFI